MRVQGHTEEDGHRLHQLIGLVAGPALFLCLFLSPPPSGLEAEGWSVAALAVWMAVWWATEAMPLFVTALLPLVMVPLLGIADIREASSPYANPVIYLLLGGLLIALAFERWNLHRRVAFHILLRVGKRPLSLIGGVMLASAFLSMWITNAATTVLMLPIAVSLIHEILPEGEDHGSDGINFPAAMVLGIAYAASIGGMGTLIGTPPNALAAGYLEEAFGVEVSFVEWMSVAVPISAVLLGCAFLVLTRFAFPVSKTLCGVETSAVGDMLRALGPMRGPEKRVAIVFSGVALGWIFAPIVREWFGLGVTDTGIAIAGAIALFAIPADWRHKKFLLDPSAVRRVPWDVVVLFGGGMSLANVIDSSGLAAWIGNGLSFLDGAPSIVIFFGIALAVVYLTELMSNTATTAALLPIVGGFAASTGLDPLFLAMPIALAASSAYMLPVATPPNALVFGSGYVTLPQMMRAGFLLSLIGAVAISAGIALVASFYAPPPFTEV